MLGMVVVMGSTRESLEFLNIKLQFGFLELGFSDLRLGTSVGDE